MNSKNISPEKIELRKKFPPTFSRRKSRSLTDKQQALMEDYIPHIGISPEKEAIEKFIAESQNRKVFFEIGFGSGEHLIHQAKLHPDAMLIGCEIFLNSYIVCLQNIVKDSIKNIRLYHNDSRYLLDAMPDDSIDHIYILFPDPWPKQRQFKRRIVNAQTLDMIYPRLKMNGTVNLATDIVNYFESMQKTFSSDKRFELVTKPDEYNQMPAGHIITKYHSKALEEKRQPQFLQYRKI